MKQVRKRATIPEDLLRDAEEYARLDHRTFSELLAEALRQHMRRYPKNRQDVHATDLVRRVSDLEEIVHKKYPQVPYTGKKTADCAPAAGHEEGS